jgi:hypothetical protein
MAGAELVDEAADRGLSGTVGSGLVEEGGELVPDAALGRAPIDGDADDETGTALTKQRDGAGVTLDRVTFCIAVFGPGTQAKMDLARVGRDRSGCRGNGEGLLVAPGRHPEGADEIEVAEGIVASDGGIAVGNGELQEKTPLLTGKAGQTAHASEAQFESGAERIREKEADFVGP